MIQIQEIKEFLSVNEETYEWQGNETFHIEGFCSLSNTRTSCITWAKTFDGLAGITDDSRKKLLIVCTKPEQGTLGVGNYIFCKDPKKVFFSILTHFFSIKPSKSIEKTAIVLTGKMGKNVSIGHGCYIGKDVEIGNDVIIGNHVIIECPTKIGNGTMIHSGVIIGTDGFGYYKDSNQYEKVPHFGGVSIGTNVEIGANTCIDRGTLDDTQIEDGVKIDNLCHIAHNVRIGKNSLIIAFSLLGGSSTVEEDGYIAPGAIVKNQVMVHSNSVVGMGAVVTRDVPSGTVVAGVPAKIIRENDGRL